MCKRVLDSIAHKKKLLTIKEQKNNDLFPSLSYSILFRRLIAFNLLHYSDKKVILFNYYEYVNTNKYSYLSHYNF